jgi:hypothetical protein
MLLAAAPVNLAAKTTDGILVDKIAAVVDEEIITLTDIEKAVRFYAGFRKQEESGEDFHSRVLDDLINYKAVYLEYRGDFALEEEDYDDVQTAVIENLGALDRLMDLLASFNMEWVDFKTFIKERVVYEKVIQEQLQVKISIKFDQIETFYNNEYLPMQQRLELKPRSLIEMTPLIENYLKKVRTRQKLAGWLTELRSSYKIEKKLTNTIHTEESL